MSAIRILLICTLLAGLLILPACPTCSNYFYCIPFTGLNGCIKGNYTEPDLPPIVNDCCGPQCKYTAFNAPGTGTCDNTTYDPRCLLDTHCVGNITFFYANITDCQFLDLNANRAANGLARYLAFDWTEATCLAQNTKCGINCCCRETCPTKFCNIANSTTCP